MKEKILHFIRTYKVEVGLCIGVVLLTLAGVGALYKMSRGSSSVIKTSAAQEVEFTEPTQRLQPARQLWVDISGAVQRPGAYPMAQGSRLSNVLEEAGGLSDVADVDFFYRNFNNARILVEQEKVYIPRLDEVQQGIFIEGRYYIDHATIGQQSGASEQAGTGGSGDNIEGKIGINSASLEELDTLSGIGEVTAQKIIDNRPYTSLEELVEKKSVGQSVFDKIKDSLVVE